MQCEVIKRLEGQVVRVGALGDIGKTLVAKRMGMTEILLSLNGVVVVDGEALHLVEDRPGRMIRLNVDVYE